jgi:hypothetical protein
MTVPLFSKVRPDKCRQLPLNSKLCEGIHDMTTYKECNFYDVIALMEAFQPMEPHCQHIVRVVKKPKVEDHKFITRLPLTYKVAGPAI